jgi:transposase InsO family protein
MSNNWYGLVKVSVFCALGPCLSCTTPYYSCYLAFLHLVLDIIGPFKPAKGGVVFLLVAIDNFTKWIKAKPMPKIMTDIVVEFMQEIFHWFDIPRSIVTDNGSQFTSQAFMEFCSKNVIMVNFTLVAHPHCNG